MENEYVNIIKEEEEKEIIIEKENIETIDATLEELTVLPSSEQQIITPTQPKTYYNKIIVEPITTENIEVISSMEDKVINPSQGKFINQVLVKGDSNLVSENIKDGVSILGVSGSLSTKYSPSFISFYYYKGTDLTEELSNLDTSKLTSMKYMFAYTNLVDLDLSNFNTENVESMEQMFFYNRKLTNLNLKNINTDKVLTFHQTFYYCDSFVELDLSNFNTENATNMTMMCSKCLKLENIIGLNKFNTSKVETMTDMFDSCKFSKIDISSFSSESLRSNQGMFGSCTNLTTLIINNPNLFKMTSTSMLINTPIASGTGYVYVPDDMVETYKSATNWSTYANQIKGMSELPEEV